MNSAHANASAVKFATLAELLRRRHASEKVFRFVADDDTASTVSYANLHRRALRLAAQLTSHAAEGERVLLLYPPGLDFLVGLFGCVYARLVAAPLYQPRRHRSDARLRSATLDSRATLALTTTATLREKEELAAAHPELARLTWLAADGEADVAGDEWLSPNIDAADVAILQYTSGSTGDPRGVALTHRCVLANVHAIQTVLGIGPGRPGVCWLPVFHDMGLIGNLFQAIYSDADLTLMAPASFAKRPSRWLRLITRHGAYVSGGPNAAYEHCVRKISDAEMEGLDLSTWKAAYCGAEPISASVMRRFAEKFAPVGFEWRRLVPCYGLAESSLMVTSKRHADEPRIQSFLSDSLSRGVAALANADAAPEQTRELVSCGRVIDGHELVIVDPESRVALPDGRVGEIWTRGPSVADGYFNRDDVNDEHFRARLVGDPNETRRYLRTGDLGFLDGGELFVAGRIKDLLIIAGRNIYPADVEDALLAEEIAGATSAAVFAIEGRGEPGIGVALECRRDPGEDSAKAAAARIREIVASNFDVACHTIVFAKPGGIPKTSSGKVRRSECRDLFENDALPQWRAAGAPLVMNDAEIAEFDSHHSDTSVREWLRERIARARGVTPRDIAIDQPFAVFGLGSLEMQGIAADLETLLGQAISPTLLYEAPTISKLARALTSTKDNTTPQPSVGNRSTAAIIGMACRFPGAATVNDYARLLEEGRVAVRDWPEDRPLDWRDHRSIPPGGYLDSVDGFDPLLFGVAPSEAPFIDPQHRLLLEVIWEAFEDAGLSPRDWRGRKVGVFVGISNCDYGRMLGDEEGLSGAYVTSGNALSMAAGRVAYLFDFTGPALAIDTACSSSLVAAHVAMQSLRAGDCDLAIVAGVNLILSADVTLALVDGQFLSPTGRCHTFDDSADGYVRGEGCGVVILRPTAAATVAGDKIRAILKGSAVNQDGTSNGITAPNGAAQAALIRAALADANARAERISYVEAHGTGTKLGDPIEFGAIADALGGGDSPCAIGAAKANLGHLEAAAGIAGLIKTVLQLELGRLFANPALETLNSHLRAAGTRFRLPTMNESWDHDGSPRLAGVSSFGFSGTNAHVILEESVPKPAWQAAVDRPWRLLTISARTDAALTMLIESYQDFLATDVDFAVVAHASNACRAHWEKRVAIVARDSIDAIAKLTARLAGKNEDRERANGDEYRARLDAIAAAYERGESIDWREIHDGRSRPWIALPSYPYERKSYWLPRATARTIASESRAWTSDRTETAHALRWRPMSHWAAAPTSSVPLDPWTGSAVVAPAASHAPLLWRQSGAETALRSQASFDRLAGALAVKTLVQLGADWKAGGGVDPASLAESLGAVEPYHRLVNRLLSMAQEDGWLRAEGRRFAIARDFDRAIVDDERDRLLVNHASLASELRFALRCADRRPDVIRGDCDPLEVLFPNGDSSELERLYTSSPIARYYNDLARLVFLELLARRPSRRPLRILEIGGGTGGTTANLLDLLRVETAEYAFTDVSRVFLESAAKRFGEHRFLRTALLDIESDPASQGFADGWFDVIVCANVLHATKDVRASLRHVQRLAAPGGAVLLLEASRPNRLLDMIFGLTEGWWRYRDIELRPNYPLLPPERWESLLAEVGFGASASCSSPAADQAVIVARNAFSRVERAAVGSRNDRVIIIGDPWGVGVALARRLDLVGRPSVLVHDGAASAAVSESVPHELITDEDHRRLPQILRDRYPLERLSVVDLRGLNDRADAIVTSFRGLELFRAAAKEQGLPLDADSVIAMPAIGPALSAWSPFATATIDARAIWLDINNSADTLASELSQELENSTDDRAVAYRDGQRHAPRVEAIRSATRAPMAADRRWIVLGGEAYSQSKRDQAAKAVGAELIFVDRVDPSHRQASTLPLADLARRAGRRAIDRLDGRAWRRLAATLANPVCGIIWIEDRAISLAERRVILGQARDALGPALTDLVVQVEGEPSATMELLASASRTAAIGQAMGLRPRVSAGAALPFSLGLPDESCLVDDQTLEAFATSPASSAWRVSGGPDSRGEPTDKDEPVAPLGDLSQQDRANRIEGYVREQVAKILGCEPAAIDASRPVASYGLDSLMAIQLKNRVEGRLGVSIPLALLLQGGSLATIVDRLAELLTPAPAATPAEEPSLDIDQLSDDDVDRMLREMLHTAQGANS